MELEKRICELQALLLLSVSEVRALVELSAIIWEHQEVKGGGFF